MNFTPGLKCNFWKRAFFPIQIKANKTLAKPKFDLFIRSSFYLNLGKTYYSLPHIFDIGKIIEDEINKSNDPLFKFEKTLKYENNKISNSLRRSLSCMKFLGSTKMQENKICMMISYITFQIENKFKRALNLILWNSQLIFHIIWRSHFIFSRENHWVA